MYVFSTVFYWRYCWSIIIRSGGGGRGGLCSRIIVKIVHVRGDVISWVTGLLNYHSRQVINVIVMHSMIERNQSLNVRHGNLGWDVPLWGIKRIYLSRRKSFPCIDVVVYVFAYQGKPCERTQQPSLYRMFSPDQSTARSLLWSKLRPPHNDRLWCRPLNWTICDRCHTGNWVWLPYVMLLNNQTNKI